MSVGIGITIAALVFLVVVIGVALWAMRGQRRMYPEGFERPGSSTDQGGQRRFRITSPWMWGGRG